MAMVDISFDIAIASLKESEKHACMQTHWSFMQLLRHYKYKLIEILAPTPASTPASMHTKIKLAAFFLIPALIIVICL